MERSNFALGWSMVAEAGCKGQKKNNIYNSILHHINRLFTICQRLYDYSGTFCGMQNSVETKDGILLYHLWLKLDKLQSH